MGLFSRTSPATEAWEALELPWRSAFSLAWEAYRVRTIPVGAVLVDGGGRIVARSRNHVFGDTSPGLSGILAHAEVMALAGLSPLDRHDDLTLISTLEPCQLCVGAAVAATIGAVRFAGRDPYAGAAAGPVADNPHARRLPLTVRGPLPGPFGALASVLHVELFLRINPTGYVVETYRRELPEIVAVAEELLSQDVLRSASTARASFTDVLPQLWARLPE